MLIELHETNGRAIAIRADTVVQVRALNDTGCEVTLDFRDPPVSYQVREGMPKVVRLVNEALYDYDEDE